MKTIIKGIEAISCVRSGRMVLGGVVRWRKETTYLQRAFKCKNPKVRLKMKNKTTL